RTRATEDRPPCLLVQEAAKGHLATVTITGGPRIEQPLEGFRQRRGLSAVPQAPAVRIAARGPPRNDGAPPRNQGAIKLSKSMHQNAELGMNGQIGLPHR